MSIGGVWQAPSTTRAIEVVSAGTEEHIGRGPEAVVLGVARREPRRDRREGALCRTFVT